MRRAPRSWAEGQRSPGSPEELRARTDGRGGSDAGLQPRYAVTSIASSPETQIPPHPLLRGAAPPHSRPSSLYTSSTLRSCFPRCFLPRSQATEENSQRYFTPLGLYFDKIGQAHIRRDNTTVKTTPRPPLVK